MKNSQILLPFLILLALLLGGYGYTYYQWQQTKRLISDSVQPLNGLHTDTHNELTALKGRILQQSELLEGTHQRLDILEEKPTFFSLAPNKQRVLWQIGEAAYLVNIAWHKLSYEQDLLTALTLLKQADELILTTHSPDLYFLHQEINSKITQIQELQTKRPNVLPLIEALTDQIEQLPAASFMLQPITLVEEPANLKEIDTDSPRWKQFLLGWWNRLKGSIQIRKVEKNETALPSFDIAIHTLVNRLEQTKIAVWRQDETAYQHHLSKIERWIEKYFSNQESLLKQLSDLKQISIKQNTPDLQLVIQLLNTTIANQQKIS